MTPICPCCGAKFAHDAAKERCKKCELPDELRADPELVRAWKLGVLRSQRAERKAARPHPSRHKPAKAPVSKYRKLAREKRA